MKGAKIPRWRRRGLQVPPRLQPTEVGCIQRGRPGAKAHAATTLAQRKKDRGQSLREHTEDSENLNAQQFKRGDTVEVGSARAEAMDGAKRGGKRESVVLRTQRTNAAQEKFARPHDRGR